MKKLLTFIFLATASVLVAQELTADTPAVVETITWTGTIAKVFFAALASFFASVTGLIGSTAYDALKKYLANSRYGQETGVIIEAIRVSMLRKAKAEGIEYYQLIQEFGAMLTDLKLDPTERARIKQLRDEIGEMAKQICKEQLPLIRGFVKDAGGKWVGERIDLLLGELVSHALGLPTI